jgi:glycosyltransferase involved in cell wall biosynthesis
MSTSTLVVAGNNCYLDFTQAPPRASELDYEMLSQFCDAWQGDVTILGTSPISKRQRSVPLKAWRSVAAASPRRSTGAGRILGLPRALWVAVREIRRADAVLARLPSPMGFWVLVLCRVLGAEFYCSIHGAGKRVAASGPVLGLVARSQRAFYRLLLSKCAKVFSTSRELIDLYGAPRGRSYLYRSSVVRQVVERSSLPDFSVLAIRLCWVGRLSPEKDPHLFIRISAEFARRGWKVNCTVVGDGPSLTEVADLAREAGVTVDFMGWIDDREVISSILKGHDFVLVTSPREGSPKILVEGMALGTPGVVATRNSTIDSYVEVGAVLGVPDFAPSTWVDVMSDAWNERVYAGLLRRGYTHVESLTLPALIRELSNQLGPGH